MSWIGGTSFIDIRLTGLLGLGGGIGGFVGAGGSYYNYYQAPSEWSILSRAITASRELPGRTHWDPPTSEVPVGESPSASSVLGSIIRAAGAGLPEVGVSTPDFQNTGQPPIIFDPVDVLLPGQTDPGREERESQEGPLAHTWLHLGSQVLGGLFPGQNPMAYAPSGFSGVSGIPPVQVADPSLPAPSMAGYSGSCPPRKTRTLTIDCATGQEIKRTRRRRPKLLTSTDMAMLFQIATLPNNANVRTALARAVRR